MSALAIDGSNHAIPLQTKAIRLKDAEKIASERLESASITSLKAALAGVTANDASPAAPSLVQRIDAATRLAADATAAARAVETLKGLLQAQLEAGRIPVPQPEHAMGSVAAADRPLPLPNDAHPAQSATPAPETAMPDQRRIDVHGFLAGFVISGAIGAVLYLYMMAG